MRFVCICGSFQLIMMGLSVEDADAWWEHIQRHEFKKYPGIMYKPPEMQP
jgi:hypothetical protein